LVRHRRSEKNSGATSKFLKQWGRLPGGSLEKGGWGRDAEIKQRRWGRAAKIGGS